jgi:S-adenosyl methyltransferase
VHDYWLGGKDNYAADRAAGDAVMAAYPGMVRSVRANRAFLARMVRFLAAEAGITQFLDIGTGIPAAGNTHEVAQEAAPGCRVVWRPGPGRPCGEEQGASPEAASPGSFRPRNQAPVPLNPASRPAGCAGAKVAGEEPAGAVAGSPP